MGSNIQSLDEFYFKFGIGAVFWNGLSCWTNKFSVSGALIENLYTFPISIQWVSGNGLWAASFKIEGNYWLFVPGTRVFVNINIGDCVGLFRLYSEIWLSLLAGNGQSYDNSDDCEGGENESFIHIWQDIFIYEEDLKFWN